MIKTDLLSDLLFKGVGEGGGKGGGGTSGFVAPTLLGIANVQISLFPQYPILHFYTFIFAFHFSGKKLVSRLPQLFGAELRHCYLFSDEQYQESVPSI